MKRVVFLALMAVALCLFSILMCCSCEENKDLIDESKIGPVNGSYEIVRIDDCQYISFKMYTWGNWTAGLIHKGNCDNPIHSK